MNKYVITEISLRCKSDATCILSGQLYSVSCTQDPCMPMHDVWRVRAQSWTVILLTRSISRSSEWLSATSTRRPARRTARRCRQRVDKARYRSATPSGDVTTPVSGPLRPTSAVTVSMRCAMYFFVSPATLFRRSICYDNSVCLSVCSS